jgi:hypothetical protein
VARLVHLGRSKRRIRFGGIIYHLDHPLAKVGTGNEARYQEVLRTQRIRAIVGLDQHLRREGG